MRIGQGLLCVALMLAGDAASAQTEAPKLPGWMAGCWISEQGNTGRRSEECWTVARGTMMLGASIAGVGFGSAGTHLPHACAYPIASLRHEWSSEGYPQDPPYSWWRLHDEYDDATREER